MLLLALKDLVLTFVPGNPLKLERSVETKFDSFKPVSTTQKVLLKF